MGYYIEVPENLNKGEQLINLYEAKEISKPSELPEKEALVCVVQNGMFDAAAYCYNNRELEEFTNPQDFRRKRWFLMDKELVEKLTKFNK